MGSPPQDECSHDFKSVRSPVDHRLIGSRSKCGNTCSRAVLTDRGLDFTNVGSLINDLTSSYAVFKRSLFVERFILIFLVSMVRWTHPDPSRTQVWNAETATIVGGLLPATIARCQGNYEVKSLSCKRRRGFCVWVICLTEMKQEDGMEDWDVFGLHRAAILSLVNPKSRLRRTVSRLDEFGCIAEPS